MSNRQLHPSTLAVRAQMERTAQMEHSVPLYLTSSFAFNSAEDMRAAFADEIDANIYSRYSNPNVDEFANKMALLEKAEAGFAVASGMAAVSMSFFGLLKAGDHLLCSRSMFGGTNTVVTKFLPRFGIEYTLVPTDDIAAWEAAIKPNTKMIYLETPTNPQLELIDLEAVGQLARKHGIIYNVDNCFATPVLQTPVDFGADLVIHSATKWLDGQGRVLGGVIVGKKELIHDIYLFCRNMGPALSPFNSWVLSKSLETLDVRIQRHSENAMAVAKHFEHHPKLTWVKYPFLPSHPQYEIAKKQMKAGGGIVCFELNGGLESGRRFMDALELLSLTPNLGDSRSIASHPASTTHSKVPPADQLAVGITPGLIRISVGLEHVDDIIYDIEQALEKA
ncbi:aminotransferase class I/II-fold pyridoxal phosphate-dependent enzyme [Niabella pedocola]|uniref:O-succinylhomoserine sulfhydrylase n=1 Tax=Niabella pedocola TaxID=1752077 RepID=A0ABS8PKY9_9BACT|nr:aminotransferase class I/II-fold pyridoxal phosphate-dependent enzyme [Niabella pedocola]MCD2421770.1 aminotransferase class I/II-fold pyridoxal phosphate-dependent enzyme [Niabella pedocola]